MKRWRHWMLHVWLIRKKTLSGETRSWDSCLEAAVFVEYLMWYQLMILILSQTKINSTILMLKYFGTILIYLIDQQWKWKSFSCAQDSLQPQVLYSPRNSPGQNTGMGSRSLPQGIFPTQGLKPGLPQCRRILYQLSYKGRPSYRLYLYERDHIDQ